MLNLRHFSAERLQKHIRYKVKRDLYIRGYLLCHDLLWGKGIRKLATHIHMG